MPKCTCCRKAIVMIPGSGRAQCFPDHTCVNYILFLWDLSTLCVCRGWFITTYKYIDTSVYVYKLWKLSNLKRGSSLNQTLIKIKHNRKMVEIVGKIFRNLKIYLSRPPTFPVQLSTWERLGYIWLLHFCYYIIFGRNVSVKRLRVFK